MNTTATTTSANSAAAISGSIFGGNQPVVGATVNLYAIGTTDYGSAPTLYATTTSQNDQYGSFSFVKSATNTGANPTSNAWGCPSSGDPQMYLRATGGNTQGSGTATNSAAGMIAALGKCSTITANTFVNLNEVTTVATMAALQQYFSPVNIGFGAPSTTQAQLGFANAITTIANLANTATGTSLTSATPTGTVSGITVTATPEYAKLNTIADIAASCVNNPTAAGANCATLFANAVPPAASVTSQPGITYPATSTNVLQSIYYMLVNPTANVGTLFGLAAATSPFQPVLSTQPSDWTIGIVYNAAGTCTVGYMLNAPNNVVVDSQGNIFVNNSVTATPSLGGFGPNGAPTVCAGDSTFTGTSYGLTVDTNDSAYMSTYTSSTKMLQYKAGATVLWAQPVVSMEGLNADGNGNLLAYDYTGHLPYIYSGASTASAPVAATQIGTTGPTYGVAMSTDGIGNSLIVNATTTSSSSGPYLVAPSTATGSVGGYITTEVPNTTVHFGYTYASGVSSSNTTANTSSFWVGNYCSISSSACAFATTVANTLVPVTFSGHTATVGTNTAQCAGGIYRPRGIAVDGAGNAWVTNYNLTGGSISEVSASGAALSPAYSGTCSDGTTGSTAIGGFQKSIIVNYPKGIAIDPSGNVWSVQGTTPTSATPAGLVEIVGAAVPAVTPIALGLKNNTVGVKP